MARKELIYTVPGANSDDNRDGGKVFHIREKSAMQVERWALRALSAVARAGIDTGPITGGGGGVEHLLLMGIEGLLKMNADDSEPLLAEMLECIRIHPDPTNQAIERDLFESDIEDVKTLFILRSEVIKLHTGFSMADAVSRSTQSARTSADSTNIQTSPAQ